MRERAQDHVFWALSAFSCWIVNTPAAIRRREILGSEETIGSEDW